MAQIRDTVDCKTCGSEQPARLADGRCLGCYRRYQREYKRELAKAGEMICNLCGTHFTKTAIRQGKRCRPCINRTQREAIKKRDRGAAPRSAQHLLACLWTPEALGENWG